MENRLLPSVQQCIELHKDQDIAALQDALLEFCSIITSPGEGRNITDYCDKEQLSECFRLAAAFHDDSDVAQKCAEGSFYCIVDYMDKAYTPHIQLAGAAGLCTLLYTAKRHLEPRVAAILNEAAAVNNPIFDCDDYRHGTDFLIGQFSFLAAQMLKGLSSGDSHILTPQLRESLAEASYNVDYLTLHHSAIFLKAKFISKVIERGIRQG